MVYWFIGLLLLIGSAAVNAENLRVYPMVPGTVWTYQQGSDLVTETILDDTVNINGVETTVISRSSDEVLIYFTNSVEDGIKVHRVVFPITGREGSYIFTPETPFVILPAERREGYLNFVLSGSAEVIAPIYGSHTLNYEASAMISDAFDVTVPYGNLTALQASWGIGFSGDIGGNSVSQGESRMFLLWNRIGPLKIYTGRGYSTVSELVSIYIPGVSDKDKTVLWQNTNTGHVWMHGIKGSEIETSNGLALLSNRDWQIAGRGDLNDDGQEDVFLRNTSTGHNWVWLIENGVIAQSMKAPLVSDTNWKVAALDDVNGDGNADIFWRNSETGQNWFWLMNGASIIQSKGLPSASTEDWLVAGLADMDGDGKADIFWRNLSSSGNNWVWLLDGVSIKQRNALQSQTEQGWQVAGLGDINADGNEDILWRHSITGRNWVWFMKEGNLQGDIELFRQADLNWKLISTKDFNGDGFSDLLWRNTSTGINWIWNMYGTRIIKSEKMRGVGIDWEVPTSHSN